MKVGRNQSKKEGTSDRRKVIFLVKGRRNKGNKVGTSERRKEL